jgi:hypothetical protein
MYRSFTIRNFRGFRDFTLDSLERVNLIAGQNNVGKTALLEAIFLHIGANNPELGPRVNAWRGLQRFKADIEDMWGPIFHNYEINAPIQLMSQDDEPVDRDLQIVLTDSSTTPIETSNGGSLTDSMTTAAAGREIRLEYKDSAGQSYISRGTVTDEGYRSERGQRVITTPGFFLSTRYLSPAEDAERFSDLAAAGKQESLLPILRLLEPRLRQLIVLVRGGVAMVHGDIGTGRPLPVPIMGEGTSRLLSLALGIASSEHGVVLIDEVENGIHYSVMTKVWAAIAKAARAADVQVFATTHSWECITAAHEAFHEEFKRSGLYDFRLHRLDRVGDDIRAVTLDQEMLDTAIQMGLEVR